MLSLGIMNLILSIQTSGSCFIVLNISFFMLQSGLSVLVFGDWMATSMPPLTSRDLSLHCLSDCGFYYFLFQTQCWFAVPQTFLAYSSLKAFSLAVSAPPPCSS